MLDPTLKAETSVLDIDPKDPDASAISYLGPEHVASLSEEKRAALREPWWIIVYVGVDATCAVVRVHQIMHMEMIEWGTSVEDILTLPEAQGFHKWTGKLEVKQDYYGETDEKYVGEWSEYDPDTDEILNLSDEAVDQNLRELGLDPEKVGQDGRAFVEKTMRRHEATKRLRAVLPQLDFAATLARVTTAGAEIRLAIVAKNPDGSGKMGAMFEFESFLTDLLHIIGYENMQALLMEDAKVADAIDQG